jgi:hypothetical protein
MKIELNKTVTEIKALEKKEARNKGQIRKLEHRLFEELCNKPYLDNCEPAYCVFQLTNTCEYVKVIRKIHTTRNNQNK